MPSPGCNSARRGAGSGSWPVPCRLLGRAARLPVTSLSGRVENITHTPVLCHSLFSSLPSAWSDRSQLCFAAGAKLWQRDEACYWFPVCQPFLSRKIVFVRGSLDTDDKKKWEKGSTHLTGAHRDGELLKLITSFCVCWRVLVLQHCPVLGLCLTVLTAVW